jgi:RNA polymerase sigma-70 factor (ECF subfamily)
MNWDFVLPGVEITDTLQASEPVMNSERFAAFYERSARPLWAYLARVSGDPSLADDLMQESYVRFLCASSPCDGEVESRRYLFRIASNLLRDHWRRPGTTSIDDLPENLFVATDTSDQIDSSALLEPAMARMRPRDRQLLWLAHAENYSHSEIAQITGLATPSIRLLLFRARRKIARILQRQSEHPVSKDREHSLMKSRRER